METKMFYNNCTCLSLPNLFLTHSHTDQDYLPLNLNSSVKRKQTSESALTMSFYCSV